MSEAAEALRPSTFLPFGEPIRGALFVSCNYAVTNVEFRRPGIEF